jgi:uncharacterized tellurite resistance protein B-like protein
MDRKDYIYYSVMKKATQDEFISLEESELIMVLEEKLGLTDDRMDDIMEYIYEGKPIPLTAEEEQAILSDRSNHPFELEMYHEVLHVALADKDIEKEEGEILRTLEAILGVTVEERTDLVARVKDEIEHHKHHSLDERLSHFFGIEE